jgi:hypothetical protein
VAGPVKRPMAGNPGPVLSVLDWEAGSTPGSTQGRRLQGASRPASGGRLADCAVSQAIPPGGGACDGRSTQHLLDT